jgi:hypothetical protein
VALADRDARLPPAARRRATRRSLGPHPNWRRWNQRAGRTACLDDPGLFSFRQGQCGVRVACHRFRPGSLLPSDSGQLSVERLSRVSESPGGGRRQQAASAKRWQATRTPNRPTRELNRPARQPTGEGRLPSAHARAQGEQPHR